MSHPRAGQPAEPGDLVDVAHLVTAYLADEPAPAEVDQQVAFGTSGHRGSALGRSFNEAHILATTQAICEYRATQGIDGPLFLGRDTHALSEPAWVSALEVLAANDVTVLVDSRDGYTPTPAVSHAILRANGGRTAGAGLADGIVVTPSHNPPSDGGFKYNPPHGGPADSDATKVIAARANELLRAGLDGVRRVPFARARAAASAYDFLGAYVDDLPSVVDVAAVLDAISVGKLAGAALDVLPEEPPCPENPLLKAWRNPRHPAHERLLINPHGAWYCEEGKEDARAKASENIRRVLLGESAINVVNGVLEKS